MTRPPTRPLSITRQVKATPARTSEETMSSELRADPLLGWRIGDRNVSAGDRGIERRIIGGLDDALIFAAARTRRRARLQVGRGDSTPWPSRLQIVIHGREVQFSIGSKMFAPEPDRRPMMVRG